MPERIALGDADGQLALRFQLAEEHLHGSRDGARGIAESAEGEGGLGQVGHDIGIAEVQQGDAAPGGGRALDEFAVRFGDFDDVFDAGAHAGEETEDHDIGSCTGAPAS